MTSPDGPACIECDHGRGWVETKAGGQTTVRPCSRCRRGPYDRWKGGHFAQDHTCGACVELLRTRTKTSR